jgi:hypothetical protein
MPVRALAPSRILRAMAREELVLPFPAASRELVPMTTHVKGMWLAAAVRSLRVHGHGDAYLQNLGAKYRDIIVHTTMNDWHPLDVLLAHYDACERLDLSPVDILEIGRESTRHAQGGVIGLTARLAASTLVTPWTILPQFQRFWDRFFRGGGVAVYEVGPKEARVEIAGFPGCRYRYCNIATRGVVRNALELFCTRVYATDIPSLTTPNGMGMRVAWA